MRLTSVDVRQSPDRVGYTRLCGEVSYDRPALKPETYWFEVPDKFAPFLSESGNPWLLCLTPVAVTLGERLSLPRAVDQTLLHGVHELMNIWSFWFPRLKPISIEADVNVNSEYPTASKTLSFFSGGVDAFFTALYHSETTDPHQQIPIDDLVNVWGFDIPISNSDAFHKIEESFLEAAVLLGKEFVSVATNLRETQLRHCDWEYMYHGAALASVAHALEKRYCRALIASSGGYHETFPHGNHPALMPLLSSRGTRIVQSGATFKRVSKIEWISRSEAARRSLHVCFHLSSERNCGRCLKCFRTMLTLDLLGVLDKFKTFETDTYDPKMSAHMFLWGDDDKAHTRQLRELALREQRMEIAGALGTSIRRTNRLKQLLAILSRFKSAPFGERLYARAENRLLRGWIGGEERYHPAPQDSLFVHYNQDE